MSEVKLAMARGVVAVVPDLFFQAKIREAARATGVPLTVVATEEALRESMADGGVRLVIVSLDARVPDPFHVLAIARAAAGVRIVGFLSHAHEDLRDRAIAAGCDEVLAKRAFSKGLPGLLAGGAAP